MSAIVKSLPIPWNDLPGSAKERLSHDALLIAQDAAAIQDAYYWDIYVGLNPTELSREYAEKNYRSELFKFRNTVERLIRKQTRQVRKTNNKTDLSDWFSTLATSLHKVVKLTSEDTRLSHTRNGLSHLLFGVKSDQVKTYFVNNPSTDKVDRQVLFNYLVDNNMLAEEAMDLVSKLDDIEIDTTELGVQSIQSYLDRGNILGLYPIREYLTDEQVLLITIVAYGIAGNMVRQFSIGKYGLITLTCNILFGVGYREFKMYALAEKLHTLRQLPLKDIIVILEKKHVPQYYIDELNRFFG